MRNMNLKGQGGFTFLTSLFDLLVLLTLLPLIALFYGYFASAAMEMDAKHLEWALFNVEIPYYLNDLTSIEVINNGGGVRTVQAGVEYDIELYEKLVRKQKFRLGHEIMLTGIRDCRFSLNGSRLTVEVEFLNGISKKTEFTFTAAQVQ